jgi:hypothetical protein
VLKNSMWQDVLFIITIIDANLVLISVHYVIF